MSKKRKDRDFYNREIDRQKAENASQQEYLEAEVRATEAKLQSLWKQRQALLKERQTLVNQISARLKEWNEKEGGIPDLTEILATSQGDLINILHNSKLGKNKG